MSLLSLSLSLTALCLCVAASVDAGDAPSDYPLQPAPFTAVKFSDDFWRPRLETNRQVTVPYDFQKCEETGRLSNFAKAAGRVDGKFEGIPFNDSDVYKVIEGAAYALAAHPDPKLDGFLDRLIADIAGAQEEDGYLYTARTLGINNGFTGPARWSRLRHNHELYNVGHLYEAAVAHYEATGKRTLLDVALKNADLLCEVFGPDKLIAVPGHEEIEIGLAKLYRVTGQRKYLELAKFFVDMRGRADKRELYGAYAQDHQPVIEQREAVGHAVRAGYLYAGVADVAALTGDSSYAPALKGLWDNVVSRKLYLTGGIGARHGGEAFGDDYELPNATAYNETCAAIANALWNARLFRLFGDAKYLDVFERIIYNGFLSGVSLSGDRFFYPNPLECSGKHGFNKGVSGRAPWFGCSCCPVNVVRFIPSLPGYVYAHREDTLYVALYVASEATVDLRGGAVRVKQTTRYPWDGHVALTVTPTTSREFSLALRIPGWAQGRPVPSDLYAYLKADTPPVTLQVNGNGVPVRPDKGFVHLRRTWQPGDRVELSLPMPVRKVVAHPNVKDDAGRVALERGPIVYCAEGVDNEGAVLNRVVPAEAAFQPKHRSELLGGITVLEGEVWALRRTKSGEVVEEKQPLVAIPYYAWAHRELGQMAVWLATDPAVAKAVEPPTLASASRASASHCYPSDSESALNDQLEPENSLDHSIPRFTWWDHRGATEWVQYDFPQPARVGSVSVYWFDDTGRGQCRVPKSWRLLYRVGDHWQPVAAKSDYGVDRDRYNRVDFEPVETQALRLEVELQPDFSGGILEWQVDEAP